MNTNHPGVYISENLIEQSKKFDDDLKPFEILESILKKYVNEPHIKNTVLKLKSEMDCFTHYIYDRYWLYDGEKTLFNIKYGIYSVKDALGGFNSIIKAFPANMFTACVMYDRYVPMIKYNEWKEKLNSRYTFNDGDYIEQDGNDYKYFKIN